MPKCRHLFTAPPDPYQSALQQAQQVCSLCDAPSPPSQDSPPLPSPAPSFRQVEEFRKKQRMLAIRNLMQANHHLHRQVSVLQQKVTALEAAQPPPLPR
jgi:hypothetical protein